MMVTKETKLKMLFYTTAALGLLIMAEMRAMGFGINIFNEESDNRSNKRLVVSKNGYAVDGTIVSIGITKADLSLGVSMHAFLPTFSEETRFLSITYFNNVNGIDYFDVENKLVDIPG